MNNIIKTLLVISLSFGLLAGCAETNPHPMDMTSAIQSAKNKADHLALAEHYEQTAKDAEAKVEEHKAILAQYQKHSYLYGKQAQTLKNHCEALINSYQKIATANAEMAKMHRSMADSAQ